MLFPTLETIEERLDKIQSEIQELQGDVENSKYFEKSSVPYRRIEHSCTKLQIRLDDLQLDEDDALIKVRRDALVTIESVRETLNSKTNA